jgi:tetratricopeptide (TPR) repeat protein
MCQWLPTNWLSETEYKMLINAFMEVFPNTSLWFTNVGHTILLGTPTELQVDFASFTQRLWDEKTKQDLEEVDLDNSFAFLAQYVCTQDNLTEYVRNVPPNTDNHPYAEFSKVADQRPNRFTVQSLFNMEGDVHDILVNVGENDDEAAQVKENLDKYALSMEHTLRGALDGFYARDIESLREVYYALSINPEDKHAKFSQSVLKSRFIDKANSFNAAGNFTEAIKRYKQALEVDPHWTEILGQLGIAYYQIGMYDESIKATSKAIEISPDFAGAYIALSAAYIDKEMYDDAIITLQKAVKIDPDYVLFHYNLGVAYAKKEMFGEAISEWEKAVELAPDSIDIRYNLAMLYVKVRRYKEAEFQLRQTLLLNPNYQPALSALKQLQQNIEKQ